MDNLPKGWNLKPINSVFKIRSGSFLPKSEIVEGDFDVYGGNGITGKHCSYNLEGENIIIGRVGAKCGNVRLINDKIWLTDNAFYISEYLVKVNIGYLSLFLEYIELGKTANQAAQPVISFKGIKDIQIPLPPLSEQTRIVAKLDALFERIDKSIALLEENIKHTKALMASVLDEVFGRDKSTKLGDVLTLKRGYDLPTQNREKGSYPLYGANGIIDAHNEFKVKGPGVCTGRSGSIGLVHFTEKDYWPLNTSLYVQDFKGNTPKYIYYLLWSVSKELIAQAAFAAVPTLDRKKAHEYINATYHSSLSEQERISKYLDQVHVKQNRIVLEQQSKLTHLKALKASLLDRAFKGEL